MEYKLIIDNLRGQTSKSGDEWVSGGADKGTKWQATHMAYVLMELLVGHKIE